VITVRNAGDVATGPISTSIPAGEFAIATDGCKGLALATNTSCTISVVFSSLDERQEAHCRHWRRGRSGSRQSSHLRPVATWTGNDRMAEGRLVRRPRRRPCPRFTGHWR
jgi:hypothetical protein